MPFSQGKFIGKILTIALKDMLTLKGVE